MASLVQHKNENAEIGELLIKVQDELRSLRKKISNDQENIDLKSLQKALEKAENGIKSKTEQFINHVNNRVEILPYFDEDDLPAQTLSVPVTSVLDFANAEVYKRKRLLNRPESSMNVKANGQALAIQQRPKSAMIRGEQLKSNSFIQPTNTSKAVVLYHQPSLSNFNMDTTDGVEEITRLQQTQKPVQSSYTIEDLSPGQKARLEQESKTILNPFNARNRDALHDNYNIQLPLIEQREAKKNTSRIIHSKTVESQKILPSVYRKNPMFLPQEIADGEAAKNGILNLLNRGIIPRTANITFDPPFCEPQKAAVHEPGKAKTDPDKLVDNKAHLYKLDPNYQNYEHITPAEEGRQTVDRLRDIDKKSDKSSKDNASGSTAKNTIASDASFKKQLMPYRPLPPPVTPNTIVQDPNKKGHRFVIQNGSARYEMADFINFKHHYLLDWGNIVSIVRLVEDFCRNYMIPVAFCDGAKGAALAKVHALGQKVTNSDILELFLNKEDIERMMSTPGRRFLGSNGLVLAAIKIQSCWRRYRDRKVYLEYRRRKWAAGVIALSWITYCKMSKVRKELKKKRVKQLDNFRNRMRDLVKVWPKLKTSRRTIIHIPSLGYNQSIRDTMPDLKIRENYQMNRLCDIMDENVDIIYVSAVPISDETLQYYFKLLGLRSAVETGNSSEQGDFSRRYKIVIPEALNSFPTHNMALSTLLKYSPKALNRINNLIKGRDAYIIPGILNKDDLDIAEYLNVPVLATEPEIAYLYSTKSGSKRIFQSANMTMPYGEYDIYNKQQLYECLAQAITENLDVQRWIFKFDDEYDGRGIASCDVSKHLSCYTWALKEAARYGNKWSKRWAQEAAYLKILSEIPGVLVNHAQPVNKKVYPNWQAYEKAYLAQGGVLEAYPPSDSVTPLTVSMLIEPDATVKIVTSGDHIHADSLFSCWGLSFPQSSVDPQQLNDACMRIADACKQRNIMGHFDIDFVTYIDAKTEKQVLWATDLNIFYSDHVGMQNMLIYMTNGRFDSNKHTFEVDPPKDFGKNRRPRPANTTQKEVVYNKNRYAVMSSRLYHTNLAVIHYSVFFQTCRAYGIGYDVKEKQGSLFTLIDSLNHTHLGMLTIGENLQGTLQQYALNLGAIHREISSANMQGQTNFLMAIEDIGNILGVTQDNVHGEES